MMLCASQILLTYYYMKIIPPLANILWAKKSDHKQTLQRLGVHIFVRINKTLVD